jgi:hypothetical protein
LLVNFLKTVSHVTPLLSQAIDISRASKVTAKRPARSHCFSVDTPQPDWPFRKPAVLCRPKHVLPTDVTKSAGRFCRSAITVARGPRTIVLSKNKRERNDRLFAVPRRSHSEKGLRDVSDLSKPIREELEKFFIATDELEDKKLEIIGWKGSKPALKAVKDAAKSFAKNGK